MGEPFRPGPLEWDRWNEDHIARHGVTRQEVQEVVDGDFVALASYKGRTVLIGRAAVGSILSAVLGPVPDVPGAYYCFSARVASRKERRLYRERYGGNGA